MTLPAKPGSRIEVNFGRMSEERHDMQAKERVAGIAAVEGRRAALMGDIADMADFGRTSQGDKYMRWHGEEWEPVTHATHNALCGILRRSLLCPVHLDDVRAVVGFLCSQGKHKPKRRRQITPRQAVKPIAGVDASGSRFDKA